MGHGAGIQGANNRSRLWKELIADPQQTPRTGRY